MPFQVINVAHELAENYKASKCIYYNDGTSEPINEEQAQTDDENRVSGDIEIVRVDPDTAGADVEIAGVGAVNFLAASGQFTNEDHDELEDNENKAASEVENEDIRTMQSLKLIMPCILSP